MPVLLVGARPSPFLGACGQACLHRIVFDICPNSFELGAAANPVVKRLILPEWFTHASQEPVRISSRGSLDARRNPVQRPERIEQHMYVIGHHDKSVEVEPVKRNSSPDRRFDARGNFRAAQPPRPRRRSVKSLVRRQELLARLPRQLLKPAHEPGRQGPVQTPRKENGAPLGVPVRQIPFVIAHESSSTAIPGCALFPLRPTPPGPAECTAGMA